MNDASQRPTGSQDTSFSEFSIIPDAPETKDTPRIPLGYAIRQTFAEGYDWRKFRADAMAGLVVSIVALPLAMALAIANGVPPQYGIATAIIAGFVIALAGGSRMQVSGPTAAFVVVLAPIAAKYGLGGLVIATFLAGFMLVGFGLFKLGKFIEYIPYPVTTGFTSGIAIVIAVLQLKDALGLRVSSMPNEFPERVEALFYALPTVRWQDLSIAALTLSILLLWPKLTKKIPSPLIALTVAAIAAVVLKRFFPDFSVATIGTRFSYVADGITVAGIPRMPPLPAWPWHLPGPDGGAVHLSFHLIRELLPSAFAIAALGAIESLLSAVVADGMAETRHDPDAELIAQGLGNLVGPFFGGFAATGAIARTATNIRSGAHSPVAAMLHAVFILLAVLLFAPLVAYLPMASLAALLLLVAWNMSEARHFLHILKIAPRGDIFVLLACFSLTVFFDMVVGVTAGLLMSSLLFMHRMAVTARVRAIEDTQPLIRETLPPNTVLYEINGPLFFGAAQKAVSALEAISASAQVVILKLDASPLLDATGLVNLESILDSLHRRHIFVILAGLRGQPARTLMKAGIRRETGRLAFCKSLSAAIAVAKSHTDAKDHG